MGIWHTDTPKELILYESGVHFFNFTQKKSNYHPQSYHGYAHCHKGHVWSPTKDNYEIAVPLKYCTRTIFVTLFEKNMPDKDVP